MSAPVAVEPDLPINRFIDELLPLHRHTTFPVARAGRLLGILSLEDLKQLPRDQWRARRARDVMRPVNSSMFVPENATLESARQVVDASVVGAVAVVNQTGELVGFLRKGHLKRKK